MDSFIIDDGYDQPGYIAAIKSLNPELRFTFRPTLWEDRERIKQGMQRKGFDQANRDLLTAVVKRIKSWSATDKDGQPLPIEVSTLRKMRSRLTDRLIQIVVDGIDGGDPDPQAPDAVIDAKAEASYQASLNGTAAGDEQAENDEKNSRPASG